MELSDMLADSECTMDSVREYCAGPMSSTDRMTLWKVRNSCYYYNLEVKNVFHPSTQTSMNKL